MHTLDYGGRHYFDDVNLLHSVSYCHYLLLFLPQQLGINNFGKWNTDWLYFSVEENEKMAVDK